jgi:hypothetical protein
MEILDELEGGPRGVYSGVSTTTARPVDIVCLCNFWQLLLRLLATLFYASVCHSVVP